MTAEKYINRKKFWWMKDWAELLVVLPLGLYGIYRFYQTWFTDDIIWYGENSIGLSKGYYSLLVLIMTGIFTLGFRNLIRGNRLIEIKSTKLIDSKKELINEIFIKNGLKVFNHDSKLLYSTFLKKGTNYEVVVIVSEESFVVGSDVPKEQFVKRMAFDYFGTARRMKNRIAQEIKNNLE